MDLVQSLGTAVQTLKTSPRLTRQTLEHVLECLTSAEQRIAAQRIAPAETSRLQSLLAQINGQLAGRLIVVNLIRDAIRAELARRQGLVETYDEWGMRHA